jgi:hypothetical protein
MGRNFGVALLLLRLLVRQQRALLLVAGGPTPDAPYVEVVPDRYTFEGEAVVFGWGVVPAPCCVAQISDGAAAAAKPPGTLLLLDSGRLLLATKGPNHREFSPISITGSLAGNSTGFSAGSRLAISGGVPVAVADSTSLRQLSCAPNLDTCAIVAGSNINATFGTVTAVVCVGTAFFVAADKGLFRCERGSCAWLLGDGDTTAAPMTALTADSEPPAALVAAGSADKVWLLTPAGAVVRWEWVTAISGPHMGSGGVLDGPATALAFDNNGTLLAGNDVALNFRHAQNGSWGRISGDAGLPFANITAIVTGSRDPITGARQLWLGTAMGLVLQSADPAADPPFHYLFGPRYHAGTRVTAMALLADGTGVVAATDGGVAWLTQESFTLARKAVLMQQKLVRHDRHGLVAGCALPGYGNISTSHCSDDDNNGLWTSLVAGAEYLRYGATKDPAAAASAAHFLGGMTLLHEITGIPGLCENLMPEATPLRSICTVI